MGGEEVHVGAGAARDEDRDYVRQQYDTYGAENVYYNDPVTR